MSIVAIVGRPNVGKSTLFNRLIEEQKAIVDDQSGVTRDRNYGEVLWNGTSFTVIDTGGYVPESDDIFEKAIREQVHIAMEEADVLIFLVDARQGITPLDEAFANIVRKSPKEVILAANKIDSTEHQHNIYDFYSMGLTNILPVSAMTGSGTGELLDLVVKHLPAEQANIEEEEILKLAIVGRPNVGKSSFVNALLGKDLHIVTPIAGTTRDSAHTRFSAFQRDIILIDTAGLRKKSKIKENIEFYATLRTVRSIEECDVALLLIDASLGLEGQDLTIFSMILQQKKGVVIVVNKWDLIEKDTSTTNTFEQKIKDRIAPFNDVPIVFTSTLSRQRLLKTLDKAQEVFESKQRKIPTSELNEVMLNAISQHHPPAVRGNLIRIKYVTQIPANTPTFLFFTNYPKLVQESYKRYLENQLRKHFKFTGVPINLFFRKK